MKRYNVFETARDRRGDLRPSGIYFRFNTIYFRFNVAALFGGGRTEDFPFDIAVFATNRPRIISIYWVRSCTTSFGPPLRCFLFFFFPSPSPVWIGQTVVGRCAGEIPRALAIYDNGKKIRPPARRSATVTRKFIPETAWFGAALVFANRSNLNYWLGVGILVGDDG